MIKLSHIITGVVLLSCSKNNGSTQPSVVPSVTTPVVTVQDRTVNVSNATQLKAALLDSRPGDDIIMADGINVQLNGSNGTSTGNKVYNNNTVTGAAAGVSNILLSNETNWYEG